VTARLFIVILIFFDAEMGDMRRSSGAEEGRLDLWLQY